jgi:hypothetical protein
MISTMLSLSWMDQHSLDSIGTTIIMPPHFAVDGTAALPHGEQTGIVDPAIITIAIMVVMDIILIMIIGPIATMILSPNYHAIHIAPVAITHGPIHLAQVAGIETVMPIDGLHGTPQHNILIPATPTAPMMQREGMITQPQDSISKQQDQPYAVCVILRVAPAPMDGEDSDALIASPQQHSS